MKKYFIAFFAVYTVGTITSLINGSLTMGNMDNYIVTSAGAFSLFLTGSLIYELLTNN